MITATKVMIMKTTTATTGYDRPTEGHDDDDDGQIVESDVGTLL